MNDTMNKMQEIKIEKITLNIGVGDAGESLEKAKTLLTIITDRKPVETLSKIRNPTFNLRKGKPIGAKVTLRDEVAVDILTKSLKAVGNKLAKGYFDKFGNFSFGVKEYIDYPGLKYDPDLGIMGFDVCVTLTRAGKRIRKRKRAPAKVGHKQLIPKEDAMEYMKDKFNVQILDKIEREIY